MNKLEGKTALITGGTSGIGLATAKAFVNEGAYTFITGRRQAELAAAVKEIGRNVTGIRGDVSTLGDLDHLYAQIKQEKGRLDIVFANAGVAKFAAFGTITEGTLRLDLRHQCERSALHGAEGAPPFAGWRFYHPEFIRSRQQRLTDQ
jgi:NAD(P)-dependent dehydrogenase (short-subunit alcohol dehydrogenase family)